MELPPWNDHILTMGSGAVSFQMLKEISGRVND